MAFVLIDSSHIKPALNDFCKLLAASVGPRGHLCLLSSSVDSLTLTSSCSQILSTISLSNPIMQFLQQSIRSQTERFGDGGLYCGILLSKLMTHMVDSPLPQHIASSVIAELACITQSELQNSHHLRICVNLDSIQPLLSVAQSVLLSKAGVFEGKNLDALFHVKTQASLLVKAFLQSEASIENVLLKINEKSMKQCVLRGILYQCTDEEYLVLQRGAWHDVSILLFTVMLTDKIDCKDKSVSGVELVDKGKEQLEAAQLFIDKAISCGINVIACQKMVHPLLLSKLRQEGILVLQRLGKHMANVLEKSTGATPISSLKKSTLNFLPKLSGCLAKINHLNEMGDDIILLEGPLNSTICSVQLTSRALLSSSELKAVSLQVLSALSQVLQDSAVCPGAGCTEMFLCSLLWKKIKFSRKEFCERLHCSASELDMVMKWLQESLLQAAGLNCNNGGLAIDSIYSHAWMGSHIKNTVVDVDKCNCGIITSDDVKKFKGSWTVVTLNHMGEYFTSSNLFHSPSLTPPALGIDAVVDVCSTKRSAIAIAVDSCIAISNVGAFVVRQG